MPRVSRSKDVESGMLQNGKENKKNLPLIIGLVLSLIAAIIFMALFIVYYQKYKDNGDDGMDGWQEKNPLLLTQLLNTMTSTRPNSEPILLDRKVVMAKGITGEKTDFRVMQFNMLADGLSGLYDDNYMPKTDEFSIAMKPANQHYLYWRYRAPLIAEEIIKYDVDIVTIQENDHPVEIELALNLKAKANYKVEETKAEEEPTTDDNSTPEADEQKPKPPQVDDKPKPENEDAKLKILWKCVYQENESSLIGEMKYLPKENKKNDNATICWRTDKFDADESALKKGNYSKITLDKEDIEKKQPYVVVKLTQKATSKAVYVVTTQLESQKTLYGELIRLNQIDQLMKVLNAGKDDAVILSADLSTEYKQITGLEPKPQAAAMYLDGEYKCEFGTKAGDAEEKYGDAEIFGIYGKKMKYTKKDGTTLEDSIAYTDESITITMTNPSDASQQAKFTVKTDSTTFKSEPLEKDGKTYTMYCTADLEKVPHENPAPLAQGIERLSGKVFYDTYNQKYEIETLAEGAKELKMKAGEKDYTIKYNTPEGTKPYYAISEKTESEEKELYKAETYGEWLWENAQGATADSIRWSAQENKLLYDFNYDPYTYNYIMGIDIESSAKVPDSEVNDFDKLASLVKDVNYDNYSKKQAALKSDYADKIKDMKNELKLVSSQKEFSDKEPKIEPDYTYYAQIKTAAGPETLKMTEDYIFNTKSLTPVGYLEIPSDADAQAMKYYPNYKYPSDHVSIMTQYRFAKKSE